MAGIIDFPKEPSTRYSAHGVIPIDNTLVDHHGKLIDDIGWFWDPAAERYKIAHDYIIDNYVCTSGKHYPLDFCRCNRLPDSRLSTRALSSPL